MKNNNSNNNNLKYKKEEDHVLVLHMFKILKNLKHKIIVIILFKAINNLIFTLHRKKIIKRHVTK